MAKVFTVKSNANRKVRATVEQYPGSCKAEDFTVEPAEGGFVIRMTVRDEAGQAFARYHDFEYAVPGIELSPADKEEVEKAISKGTFAGFKQPTKEEWEASQREAEAPVAEAPEGELGLPEGFKLGRAEPAPEVPDIVGFLSQGLDPDVDAAIEKEAAAWAQHFGVTDPEQIEGRKQVMRANVAAGHTKPLDEFLAGGRAFSPHGGVAAAAPKKARKARVAAAPAPKARKACAAAEKAPKAPAGPGKFAAIREAAERGELPPVPDFSADLHKRNRGRLAQLVEMAERDDVAGLEAFPIVPNCTSPKAMDRYRNLCVVALKARAAKPEA